MEWYFYYYIPTNKTLWQITAELEVHYCYISWHDKRLKCGSGSDCSQFVSQSFSKVHARLVDQISLNLCRIWSQTEPKRQNQQKKQKDTPYMKYAFIYFFIKFIEQKIIQTLGGIIFQKSCFKLIAVTIMGDYVRTLLLLLNFQRKLTLLTT